MVIAHQSSCGFLFTIKEAIAPMAAQVSLGRTGSHCFEPCHLGAQGSSTFTNKHTFDGCTCGEVPVSLEKSLTHNYQYPLIPIL